MSSRNVEAMPVEAQPRGYERSRLNAVRHGILSRHLLLPWEDRSEYDDLLESLVAEHHPNGPTEHHLVEELAGLMWRKQRLVMAEASACRAGLHRALEKNPWGGDPVLVRALAHLDGGEPTENAAAAVRATAEDTEAELRGLAEDEAMTERAVAILRKCRVNAYDKALAVLHEDTVAGWLETIADVNAEDLDDADYDSDAETGDRESYQPDTESLQRFLEDEVMPWYRRRRRELENRNLIRAQAFGEALDPDRLDRLARYEVHLDRKLERVLGMLLKLQDLRRTITPAAGAT
jgi:hypothetical protein